MRIFFDVRYKSLLRQGLRHSLSLSESDCAVPFCPQDFCSPCEFVCYIHNTMGTAGQSPHQCLVILLRYALCSRTRLDPCLGTTTQQAAGDHVAGERPGQSVGLRSPAQGAACRRDPKSPQGLEFKPQPWGSLEFYY